MKLAKHTLLTSSPGRPDDPAWSAQWHAYDDLARRAAYYGIAAVENARERQKCIDAAKAIAASIGGRTSMPIEAQVRMWEEMCCA